MGCKDHRVSVEAVVIAEKFIDLPRAAISISGADSEAGNNFPDASWRERARIKAQFKPFTFTLNVPKAVWEARGK